VLRLKHVTGAASPVHHNLMAVAADFEQRAYGMPPPGESPDRSQRMASAPPPGYGWAGEGMAERHGGDFVVEHLAHTRGPAGYWADEGGSSPSPGHAYPHGSAPVRGHPSREGGHGGGGTAARKLGGMDGQWAEAGGLGSGEWDLRDPGLSGPGGAGGPPADQGPRMWQAPRRRAAQHVPAMANRTMSPTPSNPEDEAVGPGLSRGSPARSQDGAAHVGGGVVGGGGAGAEGGEEERRLKTSQSAISDESLLQALYNAKHARGGM
jgi:hypothetical protein